ncbi:hypothetical protein AAFF_G00248170 [Aldrovandia affinis]|uniref:Dishevelled n=1 Tax=Aldrovandia affinis TaxID=143900 RepID=A0AAD7RDG9_9TELE|nr:hypothetical protein AAFF_G00248170 [Aldrovandia affinis]
MGDTKIIYHLDDQETPYLVKLPIAADRVTLADFKNVLNKPNYKFFFKSMDDDFGVVKEEISDDNAKLPCFNGRVVSWLVSAEGSHSDGGSVCVDSQADLPPWRGPAASETPDPPPSMRMLWAARITWTPRRRPSRKDSHEHGGRMNGHSRTERRAEPGGYESSSTVMSSELESTSFFDSEDDDSTSRFSSSTEQSSSSRLMRRHRRRRRKPKASRIERSSSFSSITDSTMSLNIITVTLNMEKYNFLGISIVGQSNERGDGGIYIGSIMKGGAVAADGRIEPGDMLLQVNDINFENMSNDDAVRVLREIVHKPGPITLTVAKCWDPNPRGCFTLPRKLNYMTYCPTQQGEPIRPIDPAAWVSHTAAMTGAYPVYGMSPSMSTITSTSSSITSSIPETERFDDFHLSIHRLEVRDRMWLKITIPNAFIGSDVVDWLFHHVEGFSDRREARRYASNLLKAGYIRHTVNKITFSEQCYYTFGDVCGNMANLSLHDHDGSSGASDQDTLAPLPHPGVAPWPLAFPYQYPIPHPYNPHPQPQPQPHPQPAHEPPHSHSAGSQHSEGGEGRRRRGGGVQIGGSGSESEQRREKAPSERSVAPPSECSVHSTHSLRSTHSHSLMYGPPGLPPQPQPQPPPALPLAQAPPGSPPGRDLASVPPELTASRQSFRIAMGNPSEFFVDVM